MMKNISSKQADLCCLNISIISLLRHTDTSKIRVRRQARGAYSINLDTMLFFFHFRSTSPFSICCLQIVLGALLHMLQWLWRLTIYKHPVLSTKVLKDKVCIKIKDGSFWQANPQANIQGKRGLLATEISLETAFLWLRSLILETRSLCTRPMAPHQFEGLFNSSWNVYYRHDACCFGNNTVIYLSSPELPTLCNGWIKELRQTKLRSKRGINLGIHISSQMMIKFIVIQLNLSFHVR